MPPPTNRQIRPHSAQVPMVGMRPILSRCMAAKAVTAITPTNQGLLQLAWSEIKAPEEGENAIRDGAQAVKR